MSDKLIYYFSGTGNSLNAAIKIAERTGQTKIISMRCDPSTVSAIHAEMIGFVFPVYHWTLPDYVKRYIEKLSINTKAYIFGIASCGGLPVNALNDFAKLINKKGANVSYSKVHNNVAGYVAAYEPFPKPEKQLPKTAAEIEIIADEISKKKCNKVVKKSIGKEFMRLIEIPFVKALPTKDKGFTVSNDCISCGLCARICTPENIKFENGAPIFQHHCSQCMACIVFCPKQAIDYNGKTQKRTKYHHPDITANMMTTNIMEITDGRYKSNRPKDGEN